MIGLTVYFVCFICCCLKDAFQNLDDSEDLEANTDYKAIETGNNLNDRSGSCNVFYELLKKIVLSLALHTFDR